MPIEIPTPEEFKEDMLRASNIESQEDRHYDMDNLMCNLLEALGYGEAIDIFDSTPKWYA